MKKGKTKQPNMKISWSVFPSDVEENILSRLPAKSLMRFRCVCKHWCNLTTKPHFIKMQLNRSTQINEGSKLAYVSDGKVYSLDVWASALQKNHMQKGRMILSFTDRYFDQSLKVSGSCNGLLLLSASDILYLLNPVTKEYKRLPFPEILVKRQCSSIVSAHTFGFGYSPRTDEYKVLLIIYYMIEQSICSDVCVYTVGINSSWRSIGGKFYKIKLRYNTLVNGALHWMARDIPAFLAPISFDFGDEKFRVLSMPHSFSQEDNNHPIGLVKFGGFLSLYHCTADGSFDIWIMKDYGDQQSWTKEFSVAPPILSGFSTLLSPLCILKKDGFVLFDKDYSFFIHDVVKEEFFLLSSMQPEMYLESLVSLRADGGVDDSEEQERREKD